MRPEGLSNSRLRTTEGAKVSANSAHSMGASITLLREERRAAALRRRDCVGGLTGGGCRGTLPKDPRGLEGLGETKRYIAKLSQEVLEITRNFQHLLALRPHALLDEVVSCPKIVFGNGGEHREGCIISIKVEPPRAWNPPRWPPEKTCEEKSTFLPATYTESSLDFSRVTGRFT